MGIVSMLPVLLFSGCSIAGEIPLGVDLGISLGMDLSVDGMIWLFYNYIYTQVPIRELLYPYVLNVCRTQGCAPFE